MEDHGGRVSVQWADGNRYPGLVRKLAQGQVLVAFPNGEQWIPVQFVAMARPASTLPGWCESLPP
jgi:hypothetical protein